MINQVRSTLPVLHVYQNIDPFGRLTANIGVAGAIDNCERGGDFSTIFPVIFAYLETIGFKLHSYTLAPATLSFLNTTK